MIRSPDALANGESDQRLYALAAWRESPFFSDRERAALAWTEAVTLISRNHAPDGVYEEARRRFTEQELVEPHHVHCRHQRLEPPCHRFQDPAGNVPAEGGALTIAGGHE